MFSNILLEIKRIKVVNDIRFLITLPPINLGNPGNYFLIIMSYRYTELKKVFLPIRCTQFVKK